MQHSSAPQSRAEKLRRWLLARRHVAAFSESSPTDASPLSHKALLRSIAMASFAYALTRTTLLFSVTPLPAALLIAAPHALPAALLGLLFSLWQGAPHPSVTLITVLIGWSLRAILRLYAYPSGAAHAAERQAFRSAVGKCIRTLAQRLCRGEDASKADVSPLPSMAELPVSLRTLCATVGGAAGAVCHCVQGGFSYYDLYGALLLLLLTPVGCALFCFALDTPRSKASSLRPLLGQAALLCAVCFCLRSVFFFGISLSVAALLALVLSILPRRGLLSSTVALLLGGMVIDVSILPPLLLCLPTYAILYRPARPVALPVAAAVALLASLAGGATFFWQMAPSVCLAALACSIFPRIHKRMRTIPDQNVPAYRHDADFSALREERARIEQLSARLCSMSGAFGGLCEVLLRMSDRLRHSQEVPGDPIHAEAFAKDCGIMAGILQDAMAEDAKALHADDERAEQLGTALRQKGVSFRQIVYLKGTDRCRIELYGCAHAEDAATRRQLQHMVQDETSLALRAPSYGGSGEEEGLILLQSRPCLSVKCAFRSLAAGVGISSAAQEAPTKKAPGCGDSVRFFSDNRERFYALLCDGMGCGEAAALTSGISVLLLERMLRAGVGVDSAMTMLNHYLFSRIGECSESTSTVDLLTIDLYSGKARFIKSGAADSLLLRNGQLYTIGCRTFPLGALSGVDVQVIPFSLQAGDHILLMSDGVADTLGDVPPLSLDALETDEPAPHGTTASNWLYALLDEPLPGDAQATQQLLDQILFTARHRGSLDDATVALLRVMGE